MILLGLDDVADPEAHPIPGADTDGYQALAVAVAVQNRQTPVIIIQHDHGMAVPAPDQGAHAGVDAPGQEIFVCCILILGGAQVQLGGVLPCRTAAGRFTEQGVVHTVGIDPAGGTDVHLVVTIGTNKLVHAIVGNPIGAQLGIDHFGTGRVIIHTGFAVKNLIQGLGQNGIPGIVAAVHVFSLCDPSVFRYRFFCLDFSRQGCLGNPSQGHTAGQAHDQYLSQVFHGNCLLSANIFLLYPVFDRIARGKTAGRNS